MLKTEQLFTIFTRITYDLLKMYIYRNPVIMLNLERTKGRTTHKGREGRERRQRTKVSIKTGRKRSEVRKEGVKDGRISNIKASIVLSLISTCVCLISFFLWGSVVLQMVVNIFYICKSMYRFVHITVSKMNFLLFDMTEASYNNGLCTEKSNATVKA